MTEGSNPNFTRYTLFTVYYDDEGDGNGTLHVDYGNGYGGTHLPIGPASSTSLQQQFMQRVPSEDVRAQITIQVQKYPRDPLVTVAEEKIFEGGGYTRGSLKDPP